MAEQIKEREEMMSDRLTRLIDGFVFGSQIAVNSIEWNSAKVKELADYLLANGVIVPPCSFFKECFVLPTVENSLSDITEMKCIGFSLSHNMYNANLITDKNKLYQPCFGDFGKTVFLTREEAEKALKESDEG